MADQTNYAPLPKDFTHEGIVNWLVDQTCFYVEDIDGLQSPLKLEKPSELADNVSISDIQRTTLSVYKAEFVYVITSAENIGVSKIGRSRDPEKRLKGLQTGSPHKLHIEYTYGLFTKKSCLALEGRIHRLLTAERLSGEWFNISAKDASLLINNIIDNATITEEEELG